uniref:RRM domain-containing protein n=1 Tax=Ditylenchus dipsaci TaxID=166011 RepID=A0A915EA91_9BILA
MNSKVVRLRNIPYGFYEKELYGYFKQFGDVKRVRVLRSKKGYPNGIAFVLFTNVAVAEIAAETMDNYILAEKRIRCSVLKDDNVPKCIQSGGIYADFDKPNEAVVRHAKRQFEPKTEKQDKRIKKRLTANLKSSLAKIKEMGINYTFEIPT